LTWPQEYKRHQQHLESNRKWDNEMRQKLYTHDSEWVQKMRPFHAYGNWQKPTFRIFYQSFPQHQASESEVLHTHAHTETHALE
jgi:hypothetical protein